MTKQIDIQDRFKFRVWDKNAKKYREKTRNQADTCLDGITGKVLSGEGVEIYGEEEDCDVVLEQCTGLKDKNGRLIYEGDIILQYGTRYKVIFSYEDVGSCGCCVPSFSGCGFVMVSVYGSRGDLDNYSELEVIGNIHENADLLENKDE